MRPGARIRPGAPVERWLGLVSDLSVGAALLASVAPAVGAALVVSLALAVDAYLLAFGEPVGAPELGLVHPPPLGRGGRH